MKLVASNLAVNRAMLRIIKDVSFTINQGDALIVSGENGAGKSTLLRAIAGLLPIEAGSIVLDGGNDDAELKEQIHYLGHQNALKSALSVKENLRFWQSFSGEADRSIEDALEIVGLSHTIDLPAGYLSTGMKRRVSIAKLLINKKPIWVADEPTAGLDGHSSKMFTKIASDFCAGGGILIAATHIELNIKNSKKLVVKKLEDEDVKDVFGEET